jgi:hypothetical protein
MKSLLPGVAFIATLAITAPVSAEGIEINVVTPSAVPRPPPETAPGGTVLLRGSPVNINASLPAAERSGGNGSGYYQPNPGWNRNYGTDLRFDGNFDAGGFDRNFDRSGLTR